MAEKRVQDRTIDGILSHLRDYLTIRGQQAIRVNAKIDKVIPYIVWQELETLRLILQKQRMFGPDRIRVADILAGDDEHKKRGLFSHSDQNSIIFEIVNKTDEQQKRVAEMEIHDMRTLFRAIDPSLERIVQLIQHWVLWDLADAALLFHFDEQKQRCAQLRSSEMDDELRAKYRKTLHKPTDEPVSTSEVLQYEANRLATIAQTFAARRAEEDAYVMIIRRDEQSHSSTNDKILELAQCISALERASQMDGAVDPQLADEYAMIMECLPEDVTVDNVLKFERGRVLQARKSLITWLGEDDQYGEPYDYKRAQAADLVAQAQEEKERVLSASAETLPPTDAVRVPSE